MISLDELDQKATAELEGYLVRKDLALRFKGQYPVPTYVGEFLIGRYCATTDEDEINEGLRIVERQMSERTVRAGESELFKSRARERGTIKVIDLITARLDTRSCKTATDSRSMSSRCGRSSSRPAPLLTIWLARVPRSPRRSGRRSCLGVSASRSSDYLNAHEICFFCEWSRSSFVTTT